MKSSFFGSLLDVIPFATYAVDIENYQVVYINKILNDRIYAPEEKLCWKKIYGQNEICSWCTVFKLMEENKLEKNKKIVEKSNEVPALRELIDELDDSFIYTFDAMNSKKNT